MSVPSHGGVPTGGAGEEVVELPTDADAAFASIMDTLVSETGGETGGQAAGETGAGAPAAPAGGADTGGRGDEQAGRPTAGEPGPGQQGGTAADGTDPAAAGAAGAAGGDQGPAAGDPQQPAATGDGADQLPAGWTASAADLVPKLGELSTKLEENTTQAFRTEAFEAVREEYPKYFEALDKHPRLLVGQQVPAVGKEGMETLRDTNDAREWQEAVKSVLVGEIQDRASRKLEESGDFLNTVHASIELFQNNVDLVPGTKDFDVELANRFAELAKPYELRVDGKLQGYSIPVQPIIDQLRGQVQAARTQTAAAAAPGQPSTGSTAPAAAAAPKPPADPPQPGIPSKAGNSGDKEDYSTLFGTIGLPNLQI